MDVALAAGGAPWETAAISEIEGSNNLTLVRRCVDVADLLALAETDAVSAALVNTELTGLDADSVHRLERAGVRVAAVEADEQRCLGLGIGRRVALGALDALTRDSFAPTDRQADDRGSVIAVWGPAGAPGRSSVALGIAAAGARSADTVLVDADTYGGSLAQMLAVLDDVSGLMAACRAANNGHPAQVEDHLLTIDEGLRVLTGLPRADMWPQIRPGALELVLRQLRSTAEVVVVDCGFSLEAGHGPAARNQATLQVLEQADHVVVVGKADPVGLSRLVRGLHDLADLRGGTFRPTVVVNMMRPTLGWKERDIESTLRRLTGLAPATFLPFDQAALDAALMTGRTPRATSPSSPFVARVEVLAKRLVSRSTVPTP